MGIVDELRNTGKGRLSYERESSNQNLRSLMKECSSPPGIQVSPKFLQNLKAQNIDGGREKLDKQDKKNTQVVNSGTEHRSPTNRNASLGTCDSGNQNDIRIVKCTVTSPEFGMSRLAMHKYEEELENKARKARLQKQREFEEIQSRIDREAELKIQEIEQKASFETLLKIQDIELRNESQAAEIVKQHKLLRETHEQRKQIHDAKIQEAEQAKRKLQMEEIRRKERENKNRQEKLTKSVTELNHLFTKIRDDFVANKYQSHISEAAKKSLNLIQSLVVNADAVKGSCQQSGVVTVQNCEECVAILNRASKAYDLIKKDLEKADKEGKEAEAERERQAKIQQEQSQPATVIGAPVAASTPVAQTAVSQAQITTGNMSAQAASRGEKLCVDIEAFRKYTELQNKLKEVEEAIVVLSSTPELKKFKFDIQKAVNTSINAISPVSGDHLRDKLKRLLQLLSCQPVEVSGRRIRLDQHPKGPVFCKYLIAKMIVKKGDEQVSSKHESAFAIGMVAAGLWKESPSIGEMLLAHFQAQCPYLVPYYLPKQEGQSDADYFKSRGYRYENGVVEKHDKFLKRMSGIMRLYFSIIVSSPPRGNHPHGLEYAWTWLTRVLNIEPEPDITTTMIYDCLQVTGNALCQVYNKQFLKLLHILVKEMLPKLKNVSSDAGSGALTRLQLLLETSVKHHGSIPSPDGFLEKNFWLS